MIGRSERRSLLRVPIALVVAASLVLASSVAAAAATSTDETEAEHEATPEQTQGIGDAPALSTDAGPISTSGHAEATDRSPAPETQTKTGSDADPASEASEISTDPPVVDPPADAEAPGTDALDDPAEGSEADGRDGATLPDKPPVAELETQLWESAKTAASLSELGIDLIGRGRIQTLVSTEPGRTGEVEAVLKANGGRVERVVGDAIDAWIPPTALVAVADADAVTAVTRPPRKSSRGVAGEGPAFSGADAWHEAGRLGAGAHVYVVDFDWAGREAAQSGGDLPDDLEFVKLCNNPNASPHGTAVAEIVHDMAPEAKITAVCIDHALDLQQAQQLARDSGAQVLNTSIGFLPGGPGDGTADENFAEHWVDVGVDNGLLWTASAGNGAASHWGGSASVAPGGFVEFAPGDTCLRVDTDSVSSVQPVGIYLKWYDWASAAPEDYELHAYDNVSCAGEPVTSSLNDQTGFYPYEVLEVFAPDNSSFGVAIEAARTSGKSVKFDIATVGIDQLEHPVAEGSIDGMAAVPGVLAVGASCWEGPEIRPYSARGPTNDGRIKPNITGPDGVSGASLGPFEPPCDAEPAGFTGTSASAPHAAGAAALVFGESPTASAGAAKNALEQAALDAGDPGAPGKDNVYGAGLLTMPSLDTVPADPGDDTGQGEDESTDEVPNQAPETDAQTPTQDANNAGARTNSSDGSLPFTGAAIGTFVVLAVLLIGAGYGFVMAGRRRRFEVATTLHQPRGPAVNLRLRDQDQ